jgi:hypothetical protein
MHATAAAIVLAGAGLLAGHALADTVPVPVPVPVPPPTVPALPVPLPAVPPAPAQPAPAVPAVPAPVGAAPAQVSGVPAQVTGTSTQSAGSAGSAGAAAKGSAIGGNGASSSPGSASPGDSPATSGNVKSVRSSRSWISKSGPKGRRTTFVTFTLRHAARVYFVVRQVSPVCRVAGRFSVRAHAGRNRVRIPGRVASLGSLDPGTYRIAARTGEGNFLRRVTIVVVDAGPPSPAELAAARAANVCQASARLASAANGTTGASNTSGVTGGQTLESSPTPDLPSASGPDTGTDTHTGGVLASSVEKATRAVRPLLVALLSVAILLLGLASLPQVAVPESRAGHLLVRHRVEIAGLGAAALLAVLITFLTG